MGGRSRGRSRNRARVLNTHGKGRPGLPKGKRKSKSYLSTQQHRANEPGWETLLHPYSPTQTL